MSVYTVQKLLREIQRNPGVRTAFFDDAFSAMQSFDLTDSERSAVAKRDYKTLYDMGVHGLLLRPFSIMNGQSEADYLNEIRGGEER